MYKCNQQYYEMVMKKSKCWSCSKFCGKCSWTEYGRFEPVAGWTAYPVVHDAGGSKFTSYDVVECPEYDCDLEVVEPVKVQLPPRPKKVVGRTNNGKKTYMMMSDGRFRAFDSMKECAEWIVKNDGYSGGAKRLASKIAYASSVAVKYYKIAGHFFKK